jgi:hypothetical protein
MITFEQFQLGFEGAAKKKEFLDGVEKIENHYEYFFANRKSKFDSKKPDKLNEHLLFEISDAGVAKLRFTDDDIPIEIIDKVNSLFKNIFDAY